MMVPYHSKRAKGGSNRLPTIPASAGAATQKNDVDADDAATDTCRHPLLRDNIADSTVPATPQFVAINTVSQLTFSSKMVAGPGLQRQGGRSGHQQAAKKIKTSAAVGVVKSSESCGASQSGTRP